MEWLIIVILAAIIVFGIVNYRKKLSSGCCGSGAEKVKKIKVQDKDLSHYPYHYEIRIDGMHCTNCAAHVENAFNKREDIMAKVTLAENKADLYAKRPYEDSEVRGIVNSAGYIPLRFTDLTA